MRKVTWASEAHKSLAHHLAELTATTESRGELTITPVGGKGGLEMILDCGFDRKGSKQYIELPRRYSNLRGAKQAARLITGESLTWTSTNRNESCS